eukprot:SAG31_NODE_2390_length_5804_cov_2.122699_5_plen_63_part_00
MVEEEHGFGGGWTRTVYTKIDKIRQHHLRPVGSLLTILLERVVEGRGVCLHPPSVCYELLGP